MLILSQNRGTIASCRFHPRDCMSVAHGKNASLSVPFKCWGIVVDSDYSTYHQQL